MFYISLVMVKNYQQCTNVTDMQTHTHTHTQGRRHAIAYTALCMRVAR